MSDVGERAVAATEADAGGRPNVNTPLARSRAVQRRLHEVVPGGAHTYAKGDDQYPEDLAPIISRGLGARVWDVDGNEYVEFGAGLRSVVLGHGHTGVLDAVRRALDHGTNFVRPSWIEVEVAERFLQSVPTADMVKFAKNGSDATTAAVRLSRAVTGRPLVAFCHDQPFFSTDDWFIGATPMDAGIPEAVRAMSITFPYGDLEAVRHLLSTHDDQVACLVLEPRAQTEPPPGYLLALRDLAHEHGALLVFDEMITGFRLSGSGGQGLYGVQPDLSTFGKALGNGFAVSALAGRREYMERGGLHTDAERVFLLSTTHGAETHSLAAAIAVMTAFELDDIAARLASTGARLAQGVRAITREHGLDEHVVIRGHESNLVFATLDDQHRPSQSYRTLFMRQLLARGIIAPSFVVNAALTSQDLERTFEAVESAAIAYRRAIDTRDPTPWMGGRSVKPAVRRYV